MRPTIFAQSTKPGKAGVAVFRISGTQSLYALQQLLYNNPIDEIIPRYMYYQKIYDPISLELIDTAMVVYFKSPASFTGEDIVEIHTHGSIAISTMLYAALLKIEGLSIAEPGEFTRRAFLNNKLDLTSAEGLADVIEAETILQHKQAIQQMGGSLHRLFGQWRQDLLTIISLLEAYIDFPDEEVPPIILKQVQVNLEKLQYTITKYLNDNRRGELLRNGIKLAIIGAPNVGKSSLINFLTQREVAIVSNIAGTTRDIIETHLDIGGYPIILQDTAGIRLSCDDVIEQEGMNRALIVANAADIKILMIEVQNQNIPDILINVINNHTIIVVNKIDLINDIEHENYNNKNFIPISITKHLGLDNLLKEIELIASNISGLTEEPPITRARHRHQLEEALVHLASCDPLGDLVLATEDIRMAIRTLSNITGNITVEEILGEIFSNFCIGK